MAERPCRLRNARRPRLSGAWRLLDGWHRLECWSRSSAFGFIAGILLARRDRARVRSARSSRLCRLRAGATGIFASQKLSVFALVIGSFAGIGIATATGSHLVPRVGFGWVPDRWGPAMDRLADLLTGLFLVGVAWYGFKFVRSSMETDLRAPVLDWPVWPFQLAIPLGFLSAAGRYFFFAVWPALRAACRRSSRNDGVSGMARRSSLVLLLVLRQPLLVILLCGRRLRAHLFWGQRQPRLHHRGHVGRRSTRS